ncbi:MAG: energy transducer TonB, partial [Sphingomonadales bacterium]
ALLIAGLAVTEIIVPEPGKRFVGIDFKDPPPPPPPDDPQPKAAGGSSIVAPRPPTDVSRSDPIIDTISDIGPITDDLALIPVPHFENIGPPPMPTIEPKIASPRNAIGRWVTDDDYRARWIREGLSGTASFTLQVSASGRVTDCRITRSTGHGVLDRATCELITRRARFNPALEASGKPVSGTFSSSIRWKLPD